MPITKHQTKEQLSTVAKAISFWRETPFFSDKPEKNGGAFVSLCRRGQRRSRRSAKCPGECRKACGKEKHRSFDRCFMERATRKSAKRRQWRMQRADFGDFAEALPAAEKARRNRGSAPMITPLGCDHRFGATVGSSAPIVAPIRRANRSGATVSAKESAKNNTGLSTGVLWSGRRGNRRSAASGGCSEPISRKRPDCRANKARQSVWRDGERQGVRKKTTPVF